MTEAEVLKALEHCLNDDTDCEDCPSKTCCDGDTFGMVKAIYDLINRQKAEIERLTTMHSEMCIGMKRLKYKARKEFAERLRKTMTATSKTISGYCKYIVTDDEIDNLLKEMDGEGNV